MAADEQLDMLRSAHRSARESIRTFSAKVTCETTAPEKKILGEATYWRSIDMIRIQLHPWSGGTDNVLVRDGEIRQVGMSETKDKSGRQIYLARRAPRSSSYGGTFEVWGQLLIDFYGPDGGQFDFDRFLGFAKETPRVDHKKLNGIECVRLRMSIERPGGSAIHYVLWHDVSRNYLVRKIEMTFDGSDYQFEAENLDFVEPQPGVFMPIRCVRRGREGDHYNESVTSITDVQINRPIPDRVFQLPRVPSGTPLDDEVRGTKYTIDSEWQRIGKEEPIVTLRVAQPAEEEQSEYSSQSVSEPGSFTRWIIPLSIVILAGAGVAWYIRRRRRRRDEDGVAAERA